MSIAPTALDFLKSPPGQDPILVSGLFRAPTARVFRAFTDPADIDGWFMPGGKLAAIEIDLRVGGRWTFVLQDQDGKMERLEGEYLEIDAPNHLKFSWRHVVEHADGTRQETDRSFVTITFAPAGKATEVNLRHEAIKSVDGRLGVGTGWDGCLHRIAGYLAQSMPEET